MVKVICYCGKSLDDPTHKETHQDKFLTGKEMLNLEDRWPTVVKTKYRTNITDPWNLLYGKRVGNSFHMIGIYKP